MLSPEWIEQIRNDRRENAVETGSLGTCRGIKLTAG